MKFVASLPVPDKNININDMDGMETSIYDRCTHSEKEN